MRILKKEFSLCAYTTDPQGNFGVFLDPATDWQKFGPNNFFTIGSESYIDLAGMSQEEKTVAFNAITVQGTWPPSVQGANVQTGAQVIVHDVITSIPINLENVQETILYGFGQIGSDIDYQHVIYNRTQIFAIDLDFAGVFPILAHTSQTGSGEPTASDRLYCYRFVNWSAELTGGTITIFPARHVIEAGISKESELEYIYRLKRSYDLQQSYDND